MVKKAGPMSLKRAIKRVKRQLNKQDGKMLYSDNLARQIEAKGEIKRLESKLIRLEQALILAEAEIEHKRGMKHEK